MSTAIFPVVRGLDWVFTRTPVFNTAVTSTASLKSIRAQLAQYPQWKFKLTWNYLINDPNNQMDPSITIYKDLEAIIGFWLQRGGGFDNFLLRLSDITLDQADSCLTAQKIGTGDGSTTQFQLVRTFGGFTEQIQAPDGVPTVFINGVATTAFTINASTGIITFTSAPASGAIISVNCNFFYRVRFADDSVDWDSMYYQMYELKQINLITDKL